MRSLLLACAVSVFLFVTVLPSFANDAASGSDETKSTTPEPKPPEAPKLDTGDTAWMLVSTGLVLFMVPGLALFYGGMVRRKNVLGTMMHSMVALAIIGIQWVLFGYALAFGKSQHGIIGWDTDLLGLWHVAPDRLISGGNIPVYVHCMYQGMFAIITPALISGAIAERIRFGPYCLFIFLWGAIVYLPLAHWVWAFDDNGNPAGWLGNLGTCFPGWWRGALDFAGGTVVHIAAGVSGLAAILVLRKRFGYPEHAMHPNSMVLTLTGAGLLWFGWFGFNGGSALTRQRAGRIGADGVPNRGGGGGAELDGRRMAAQGQADGPGIRVRPRCRVGGHHTGVGLRPADARDGHRVNRRCRLLRHGVLEAAARLRRFAGCLWRTWRRRFPGCGADGRVRQQLAVCDCDRSQQSARYLDWWGAR